MRDCIHQKQGSSQFPSVGISSSFDTGVTEGANGVIDCVVSVTVGTILRVGDGTRLETVPLLFWSGFPSRTIRHVFTSV